MSTDPTPARQARRRTVTTRVIPLLATFIAVLLTPAAVGASVGSSAP